MSVADLGPLRERTFRSHGEVLEETVRQLAGRPGLIEVRLGGSFARGEADAYSGLDVAPPDRWFREAVAAGPRHVASVIWWP